MYVKNLRRIPELKQRLDAIIGEILPQLWAKVIENFVKRARSCQQERSFV